MDFKNVQRRVYDATNVLSALGIIKKERGNIIWKEMLAGIELDLKTIVVRLRERAHLLRP